MKSMLHILLLGFLFFSITFTSFNVNGQPSDKSIKSVTSGDSLSLSQVLQSVMQSHPSIKEAEEALNAADARIGLAKSGYYPNVDVSASFVRIGPVASLTFPPLGTFQLYPENNYSAALNYEQTLYDFGKTAKNVTLAKESKTLSNQNIELIKQKLALLTINTFYSLVYLQEAIRIKDEQLVTLKEHLEFIEKKKATGSATQYEYLSTKVKISNTESQKLDLVTMQKIQRSVLNTLLGMPAYTSLDVKQEITPARPAVPDDSLISYAFNHRIEITMAKEREKLAGLQYQVVKTQNNPMLDIFASGGGKNGYFPDLNAFKANYSAGLGLSIPILNGTRLKNNLLQAKSTINNSTFETEIARRNISNEVTENEANCTAAKQKIDQFELQLAQAEEAFSLAKINFKSGSITNLDLLDAETTVSESRLLLLKANIDYSVSVYKLNIAVGNKMY